MMASEPSAFRAKGEYDFFQGMKRILPKHNTGRVRYTEHIDGEGERLFRELEKLQLEGMVAKRRDSVYVFQRSRAWLKTKAAARKKPADR